MRVTRRQLSEIIRESVEELEYFGQGVKNLIDDPDVTGNPDVEAEIFKLFGDVKEIGEGAFRTAYSIPGRDDVILKVARNRTGTRSRLMNKLEVEAFDKFPEFFPKVYMRHKEGAWMVVERVRVIEPGEEKLFGEVISKNFKFASSQFIIASIKAMMTSAGYRSSVTGLIADHADLINLHIGAALFLDIVKCFGLEVVRKGLLNGNNWGQGPSVDDEIKKVIRKRLFSGNNWLPGLFGSMYKVVLPNPNIDADDKDALIDFLDINTIKYPSNSSFKTALPAAQEALVTTIFESVLMNFKFVKFMKFLVAENATLWDIRLGNIATDLTHSRFMIIDAGIGN